MTKINELIEFEEIKDVIDIDTDLNSIDEKKEIVKDYIISKRLQEHLLELPENFSNLKHKSIIVIGSYGCGKSHLLGWIVSLLESRDLIEFINNEEVKKKFNENLERDFAVVQFELQPGASALSEYFFDRVQEQLKIKYELEIESIDKSKTIDYKKEILKILVTIKEKDPKRGFIVCIDEISDFLKQKEKYMINRDIQFLRILGQVSQSEDFLFIGSMQENVFTNPKYIEEAESFGRVSERFDIITISREDIKRVISNRVLKKDLEHRKKIDDLLDDFKSEFPPINSNPDAYIDLFPIHPYVIDLFSELPYFEKRGAIQFSISRVKEILQEDFPQFITIDKIFDEINSKHTLKNLDEIKPIIEIVNTLNTKIDLLDSKFQDDARRLVKTLALLSLYGKTKKNGATPEELANELLIRSKTVSSVDRIIIILDKIRSKTNGQFIGKSKNNYYYLDLEKDIDYDLVIERKIQNLPKGSEDEELLKIIKYVDLIDVDSAESYTRVFKDSCSWTDKKSYRLGNFIYNDKSGRAIKGDKEFNLIIESPYGCKSEIKSSENTAVLKISYNEEIDDLLKKLASIRLLINENYAKSIMQKRYQKLKNEAKDLVLKQLINSEIKIGGNIRRVKTVITKEPDILDEFFHSLKENLFNDYFNSKYPKYPKFLTEISYQNITGTVEDTINGLIKKSLSNMFSTTKNLLSSLNLIDAGGDIDTSNSFYANIILNQLNHQQGKNVKIEDLVEKLNSTPFGLDKQMSLLVLIVLTYNGEINLIHRKGNSITSSDLGDVFKKGLKTFKNIPYAKLETEFPMKPIIKLFKALNLNHGLVRNPKDRTKAVQEFKKKVLTIKNNIDSIKKDLNYIIKKPRSPVQLEDIEEKINKMNMLPLDDFLKVNTVNDFKKVEFNDKEIKHIEENLAILDKITEFVKDFDDYLYDNYIYMLNSINWLKKYPKIFSDQDLNKLIDMKDEINSLLDNFSNLLNLNQRRLLKGKFEQYKIHYTNYYQEKHNETIGKSVSWNELEKINRSDELRRLRDMKAIRCINSLELKKLDEKIISLSNAKCTKLITNHLENNYICTWCRFPETIKEIADIDSEINIISNSIEKIVQNWINTILDEIKQYKDNLSLLSDKEREIIKNILSEGDLPSNISQEIINALNNLFSELELIEITPKDFFDHIFSNQSILDYISFVNKLEQLKKNLCKKGKKKKNIRLKVKEVMDNEQQ